MKPGQSVPRHVRGEIGLEPGDRSAAMAWGPNPLMLAECPQEPQTSTLSILASAHAYARLFYLHEALSSGLGVVR